MNASLDGVRNLLRCPVCRGGAMNLEGEEEAWARCEACGAEFAQVEGIPFLMEPATLELCRSTEAEPPEEPSDESVKRANIVHYNGAAEKYDESFTQAALVQGRNCQGRIRDTLRRAAERTGGRRLLDVCCGTGNVLRLAAECFEECLGIDMSRSMLSVARERGLAALGADVANIPLADESFDCVTCFAALHHLFDYSVAVREMARVLKPGGVLYTDWDPNGRVVRTGWAMRLATALLRLRHLRKASGGGAASPLGAQVEFHHHCGPGFSGERVAEVLRGCGFAKVDVLRHINPPTFARRNYLGVYGCAMVALKAASLIWPSRRNTMPLVAVVAQK